MEQFGLKPREQTSVYWRSYPDWFDKVSLPPQYRVPDFTMFSDTYIITSFENVS
jgi:hypothetical protein